MRPNRSLRLACSAWNGAATPAGSIGRMRSVILDDGDFAQLIGDGGLYDYELGERYVVAPAPSSDHGELQNEAQVALTQFFGRVSGPINLGVLGEPGTRWYVVPDAVVLPLDAPRRMDAQLRALITVEVRSPRERIDAKLAHYREVVERTGLVVDEVWYIDGDDIEVHPNASADIGVSEFSDVLEAVRNAVRRWRADG